MASSCPVLHSSASAGGLRPPPASAKRLRPALANSSVKCSSRELPNVRTVGVGLGRGGSRRTTWLTPEEAGLLGLRPTAESPRSVPVRVAHELLLAGHHYLDIRTPEDFERGHAAGAINIPYVFNFGQGLIRNLHFLEQVAAVFGKDTEIIVGCLDGKLSPMAASDLASAGFTGITDIAGGFSSWMNNALPCE